MTYVPTRGPLLASALANHPSTEEPRLTLEPTGQKRGQWLQHLMPGQPERLARKPEDWVVNTARIAGRPVVLLDDVFVTGASMYTYAAALRRAGATEVRGVAVSRHVRHTHNDYFDALRIVRRRGEFRWTADRARVTPG